MHVRYLIHHAKVARGDCCGAAMRQLRQPGWLQSEERVSSRSAARRQKRCHQWHARCCVSNQQTHSTSKLENRTVSL